MAENETKNTSETEPEVKEQAKPKANQTKKSNKKENAEILKLQEEVAAQKELLLRTAAEFDNFKRRTEKERLMQAEYVSAGLLKKLLPVFDNVDRANSADKESAEYSKGVELIVKMLNDAVKDLGLVEIGAVGDEFNPNLHEAVMHIDDENFGENVISQVLQKGYKYGDTVIRPAMVQVAN